MVFKAVVVIFFKRYSFGKRFFLEILAKVLNKNKKVLKVYYMLMKKQKSKRWAYFIIC